MPRILQCSSKLEGLFDWAFQQDPETQAFDNLSDESVDLSQEKTLILLGHSIANVLGGYSLNGLKENDLVAAIKRKYPHTQNKDKLRDIYFISCNLGLIKNNTSFVHNFAKKLQEAGFYYVRVHAIFCPEKLGATQFTIETIGDISKDVLINAWYHEGINREKRKYICKDVHFVSESNRPCNTIFPVLPKKNNYSITLFNSLSNLPKTTHDLSTSHRKKLNEYKTALNDYIKNRENEAKIDIIMFIFLAPYYFCLDYFYGYFGENSAEGHFDPQGRVFQIDKAKDLKSLVTQLLENNDIVLLDDLFCYTKQKGQFAMINNNICSSYQRMYDEIYNPNNQNQSETNPFLDDFSSILSKKYN